MNTHDTVTIRIAWSDGCVETVTAPRGTTVDVGSGTRVVEIPVYRRGEPTALFVRVRGREMPSIVLETGGAS